MAIDDVTGHLGAGLVLFEYSSGRADRARALYRAYRRAGGPGFIERPGNFSMVVAQIAQIAQIARTATPVASTSS